MRRYKKVYLEITNICNLKCNFCPETKRQLKYMNVDEFKYIISQIKCFTDHIYFHLMGEPLLNKNLSKFMRICHQSSLKVNITTNGTMINDVKYILYDAPALRKVSISLHSFEANKSEKPEILDRKNNQNVKLKEYIADILDFVKYAVKRDIICELRLWNLASEGIEASNSMNKNIVRTLENELNIDFNLESALIVQNNLKVKNNLYLHAAQKFEWPDINKDIIEEQVFCYGLRDQFGILVDGTVVPCCLDSEGNIALGNIFEKPLADILNSEKAQKIYNGFTNRFAVEDLCKKCGFAKRHKR